MRAILACICFTAISLLVAGNPRALSAGEFQSDDNTLFLAHYNTSLDADYSKGSRLYDRWDTAYLTKTGGYFGGGLVCRVGAEALKEAGANITTSALMPARLFDGVRYAASDNLDFVRGTFECWLKPYFSVPRAKDMQDNWPMQYDIFCYTETPWRLLLSGINSGADGSNVFFYCIYTQEGNVTVAHAVDWKPGTWHHVAMTWDTVEGPGSVVLFLDGRKAGSASLAPLQGKMLKAVGVFSIGAPFQRKGGNNVQFFKADAVVDEVRISNIVRYQSDFLPPGRE